MDWALVVIWLSAGGSLEPKPWVNFPTEEACDVAKRELVGDPDLMLFMAGCVHKPSLKNLNYQAFDVTVEPGMKR